MKSGIITIVDDKNKEIHCCRYHSKLERQTLIEKWMRLYNVRLGLWFIHVIPCIPKYYYQKKNTLSILLDPIEIISKPNIEDMYSHLTNDQKGFIKKHLKEMSISDMADYLDLNYQAVSYWHKKYLNELIGQPEKEIIKAPEEPVEKYVRPKGQYSNRDVTTLYR